MKITLYGRSETACEQARSWLDAGLPSIRVAVNLSSRQFARWDLSEVVSRALDRTGLPPDILELEVTESLLMEDTERSEAKLALIKSERGVRVPIDDFGTGHSSLAYLKRFPLDVLKIDGSFVRDLTEKEDDATIVPAIIGLAHNPGLKVIAEGVETAAQLDYLRRQNCDEAQGYYFGRPVSAEKFADLMRENEISTDGIAQ